MSNVKARWVRIEREELLSLRAAAKNELLPFITRQHLGSIAARWVHLRPGRGPNGSAKVGPAVRERVLARSDYACVYCGSTDDLTMDHIVPLAAGGVNRYENLQAACRRCNAAKADGERPDPTMFWRPIVVGRLRGSGKNMMFGWVIPPDGTEEAPRPFVKLAKRSTRFVFEDAQTAKEAFETFQAFLEGDPPVSHNAKHQETP